ncbi:hypothetical protein J1614_006483 [Plenodomus biglobosus]|nr:hypothetical protein J1614_006483 [Plenodomus biglobosus]
MFDLTYPIRRPRNHRFPAAESVSPYMYADYVGAYNSFGNFRNGLFDYDRSTPLVFERGTQNFVEDATRAHVAAKADWEKAKEKFDDAKKKLEEGEKKLKECEERLRAAKNLDRYG